MDNDQARSTLRLHVTRDINADIERLPAAEVMNKTAGRNDTYAVNGLHPAEPRITFSSRDQKLGVLTRQDGSCPTSGRQSQAATRDLNFRIFHWLPTMVYRILDLTTLVSSSRSIH